MEYYAIEHTDNDGLKYIVCRSVVFSFIYRKYLKIIKDFPLDNFRLIKVIRIN